MKRFVNAWYDFMHHQWGAVTRSRPSTKQRKYQHIEIQKDFLKIEQARKQQRFRLLTLKRKILSDRLLTQKNLLEKVSQQSSAASTSDPHPPNTTPSSAGPAELQSQVATLTSDIKLVETELLQFKHQLKEVETKLQQTESEYVLLRGLDKLIVENEIDHIMYMTMHGFTLHPETQKCVENVHYLLEHNLPVPKYRLYEVMPHLFKEEIGELTESARRLIEEKKLVYLEDQKSLVRIFQKKDAAQHDPVQKLIVQKNNIWQNINNRSIRLLQPHAGFLTRLHQGQTRWRGLQHFYFYCLDCTDVSKFIPEQLPIRQALLAIETYKEDFEKYMKVFEQSVQDHQFELRVPVWVLNSPKLTEFWIQRHQEMVASLTPISEAFFVPDNKFERRDELERRVREELSKVVGKEVRLEGKVRGRVNKNEAYQQVLKAFTKVLNEFPDDDELPSGYQSFQKLSPKDKQSLLTKGQQSLPEGDANKISVGDLAKIIDVNNKNPQKYNLEFFSKYFGVDIKLLQTVLNSISFPLVSEEKKYKFLKFITAEEK